MSAVRLNSQYCHRKLQYVTQSKKKKNQLHFKQVIDRINIQRKHQKNNKGTLNCSYIYTHLIAQNKNA